MNQFVNHSYMKLLEGWKQLQIAISRFFCLSHTKVYLKHLWKKVRRKQNKISSIMMGHRPRQGQQVFSQYADRSKMPLWCNQSSRSAALSVDPEDFACPWHLDQRPFRSNGAFTAPFIHTRVAPGQNSTGELESSQVNKYTHPSAWNRGFFTPQSLHLCFSWACSLTRTWFKAS